MNFIIFCVSPLNYFLLVSHQILATPQHACNNDDDDDDDDDDDIFGAPYKVSAVECRVTLCMLSQ